MNRIQAMLAERPAIPVIPRTPAIKATIKKVKTKAPRTLDNFDRKVAGVLDLIDDEEFPNESNEWVDALGNLLKPDLTDAHNLKIKVKCTMTDTSGNVRTGEHDAIYNKDGDSESLKKQGADDIIVFVGGVIPRQDYDFLYEAGVKGIYGPGTPIPASAKDVLEQIRKAMA